MDEETKQNDSSYNWLQIMGDRMHKGAIKTTGFLVGSFVDAANNTPRILNLLPGEQGFTTISDRPFLGTQQINEDLGAAHEGYKDIMGLETPEPVTMAEHAAALTGEVMGGAVITMGAGSAVNLATGATGGLSGLFVKATDNPVMAQGGQALGWISGQVARLTTRFAISNPLLVAGGATVADNVYNGGQITRPLMQGGTNKVAESMGIAPIFGENSLTDPNGGNIPARLMNAVTDPTQLAGMGIAVALMTMVLKNFTGTGLGIVASLAVAMMFQDKITEAAHTVKDAVQNAITPQPEPVPVPIPAAPGPR